jgi:hypothetical protein
VILGITGALLWMARPDLLPLGGGGDLTHHLQFVGYIEQNWRLPVDADIHAIGGMIDYTPGAHLLASLAGASSGRDGLHAMHPLLAVMVALKAGVLFLIARRALGDPEFRTARPRRGAAAVPAHRLFPGMVHPLFALRASRRRALRSRDVVGDGDLRRSAVGACGRRVRGRGRGRIPDLAGVDRHAAVRVRGAGGRSRAYVLARTTRADTPYLALKMVHLAIYPMAVLASAGLGAMVGGIAGLARRAADDRLPFGRRRG